MRVWFRLGGVKNTAQYRGVYPVPTDGEPPSQQCQAKRAECIANALAKKKLAGICGGNRRIYVVVVKASALDRPGPFIRLPRGITVFDLGFFDTDSFAYDVYRFWHHLECMKVSPIMSRRKVAWLQESFLAGYGRSVDFATPVFRLAACQFNLVRLDTLATNPAAAGPRGWMDRRLIARCHAWLVHDCGPI